jgi:hypothetical protein
MELKCGVSWAPSCCSNCQSAVRGQESESKMRELVVLPGLPITQGSLVRDERAPGLLLIPAATNEEAVCTNNSNRHPNPHIIHHLGVSLFPLARQVGGQPLFSIPGLASHNSVNQVYHRCKVLLHFQTGLKVLVLLLLLVLLKNFPKFLLSVGPGIRVCDTHIKYACLATFPEPVAARITPFLGGSGWWLSCVCGRSR